ncbi:MAG: MFS transporter [Mangrovibacterium sp.]
MAIVVGILLSLISNYLLLNTGEHNWRWMFFTGAVPAVVFSMMLLTIKKSPPLAGNERTDRGSKEKYRRIVIP